MGGGLADPFKTFGVVSVSMFRARIKQEWPVWIEECVAAVALQACTCVDSDGACARVWTVMGRVCDVCDPVLQGDLPASEHERGPLLHHQLCSHHHH